MNYEVHLSRRAHRYLSRLTPEQQRRIARRIEALRIDPFADSKSLAGGGGRHSARVGDLRIIFSIDLRASLIEIRTIGPRGDIYKDL